MTLLIDGQNEMILHCADIGTHTVTLSATDGNLKTTTCEVELILNGYLDIASVEVTDETCSGQSNGSITVDATAPTGSLFYSIDGGNNFSSSPILANLVAGTYELVVIAQGSNACNYEETVTVETSSSVQTWYKDYDNDGYSDGLTLVGCSQPLYFKAAQDLTALPIGLLIDCNDNDASIHPNATEICNGLDEDCNGIPENASNTWTGTGDGWNWFDKENWSDGLVPLPCQDIVIPTGNTVIIQAGETAVGKTLDVEIGAVLEVEDAAVLSIEN